MLTHWTCLSLALSQLIYAVFTQQVFAGTLTKITMMTFTHSMTIMMRMVKDLSSKTCWWNPGSKRHSVNNPFHSNYVGET